MGKLRAWIESKLSAAAAPTKPASSKFGGEDRAAQERAKDYETKMATERERSRRSSF